MNVGGKQKARLASPIDEFRMILELHDRSIDCRKRIKRKGLSLHILLGLSLTQLHIYCFCSCGSLLECKVSLL